MTPQVFLYGNDFFDTKHACVSPRPVYNDGRKREGKSFEGKRAAVSPNS